MTSAKCEIVRDIEETFCSIALNFEQELITTTQLSGSEKSYKLPIGQVVRTTMNGKLDSCIHLLLN
jgi:hypothetical protein